MYHHDVYLKKVTALSVSSTLHHFQFNSRICFLHAYRAVHQACPQGAQLQQERLRMVSGWPTPTQQHFTQAGRRDQPPQKKQSPKSSFIFSETRPVFKEAPFPMAVRTTPPVSPSALHPAHAKAQAQASVAWEWPGKTQLCVSPSPGFRDERLTPMLPGERPNARREGPHTTVSPLGA